MLTARASVRCNAQPAQSKPDPSARCRTCQWEICAPLREIIAQHAANSLPICATHAHHAVCVCVLKPPCWQIRRRAQAAKHGAPRRKHTSLKTNLGPSPASIMRRIRCGPANRASCTVGYKQPTGLRSARGICAPANHANGRCQTPAGHNRVAPILGTMRNHCGVRS